MEIKQLIMNIGFILFKYMFEEQCKYRLSIQKTFPNILFSSVLKPTIAGKTLTLKLMLGITKKFTENTKICFVI